MGTNQGKVSKFKEIMGCYPTGVTVITTFDNENKPVGMTVNSFSSVSIDPLLILWSIRKNATEFDTYIKAKKFAVNILDGSNTKACKVFASKDKDERFEQIDWRVSNYGLPLLNEVYGIMECKTIQQIDAGDHIIIVGQVTELEKLSDTPMLYYKREMGHIPSNWVKNA
ncbi:flavin reductase family protein [Bacillus sp. FJAT-50079]|uniref:flavin reductase family protein n=1 Tax=Bacillus sp. FJAT-50079 TaxID=2833577 RepID=UPI001BC90961|nr:flavin reductase family protein [Bacillus sp. FJAT-50079]MBS4206630.1 flavin reductase family protein [Bacillus sp. FJAT-50079]